MNRLSTLRALVHQAREVECETCDGEGEVLEETPGGRYDAAFGNYLPHEVRRNCEACNGVGAIRETWCPACEDTVRDGECSCDTDQLAGHIAERIAKKPDRVREHNRRMYHVGEWNALADAAAQAARELRAILDYANSAEVWLALQQERITDAIEREQRIHTAPDEVVHRRVDGRTVIARRLLHRRTTNPPLKGQA